MAEIRSAFEIAMDRADRLGRATREEMETEKWLNHGRREVTRYLQGEKEGCRTIFDDIPQAMLPLALKGATEVLLRNIVLPKDRQQWSSIKKALSGLLELKGSAVNQIIPRIEHVLKTYEQTRDKYYRQLNAQMQRQFSGLKQNIEEQYGIDVSDAITADSMPEFQQEWSRISSQITEQFENQLIPLKTYMEQL